jgi:hypothetical protein
MITVEDLIDMLRQLPSDTRIFTSGMEGLYPMELGNLCPFKVAVSNFGKRLYIDDGIAFHDGLTDHWVPLNEFIRI